MMYNGKKWYRLFKEIIDIAHRKKIRDKAYKQALTDAIKIFSKYKNEPMTGNVVLLEQKVLRGDYESDPE